jgi:hypothetical protein
MQENVSLKSKGGQENGSMNKLEKPFQLENEQRIIPCLIVAKRTFQGKVLAPYSLIPITKISQSYYNTPSRRRYMPYCS